MTPTKGRSANVWSSTNNAIEHLAAAVRFKSGMRNHRDRHSLVVAV